MAIASPGGEAVAHIHKRARELGVPYQVIDRPAGKFDPVDPTVGRLPNDRVVEALYADSKAPMADEHGAISTSYRAIITEPPMGHTEADRAALAAHPVTVIGRVNLVTDTTT